MKINRIFQALAITACYGLFNCSALQAAHPSSLSFQAEEQIFYKQIEDLIAKDQKRLQELQERAYSRKKVPMWSHKVELEQAIITLDVKKVLYANFKNTLSIESSLVREKLLSLMRKDNITMSDLAELQALTEREKQRLREEKAQTEAQKPAGGVESAK
ncbi:hypothetical protein PARA125_000909 [Parachlamydia sp. AcF125]|nr:hypothetical protein [Parachlamydia sp. AcF125]